MKRPLVIGYGNTLRGDDGVGRVAAETAAADPRLSGVTVIACHQLTPELAVEAAAASAIVFVDAHAASGRVGSVAVTPVVPSSDSPGWAHHVTPGTLLGLVAGLGGTVPPAFAVRIGVRRFGFGEGLSPEGQAALAAAVTTIAGLLDAPGVSAWSRSATS